MAKATTNRRTQAGTVGLAVLSVVTVLLVGAAVTRNLNESTTAGSTPGFTSATTSAAPLRVAVVGDSVTEADSPDFSAGRLGSVSWVPHALGDGAVFAGGWADGGATTERIASEVQPVESDVLVILAGTNDSGLGIPFDQTEANMDLIVSTVGAPRVVVSSIPPRDDDPDVAADFNQALEGFAVERGWEFVDGSAALRDGDTYGSGLSSDGVHPTPEGARLLGEAIRPVLVT